MSETLDEVVGAYKALSSARKIEVKSDIANAVHKIVDNLTSTNAVWVQAEVIVRCLLFMDTIVKDHHELFLVESDPLLHQLQVRI